MFAPGTIIPEVGINGPVAPSAYFRKWPDIPRSFYLTMTPGAIPHKSYEFATAVFAPAMITHIR